LDVDISHEHVKLSYSIAIPRRKCIVPRFSHGISHMSTNRETWQWWKCFG